jgi:uncharacterized protein
MGGRGGGGGMTLLMLIGQRFGMKGILVAVVAGLALWKLGLVDPGMLTGGGTAPSRQISAHDQERFEFSRTMLASTEQVWSSEFARHGRQYQMPTLTIYRGAVGTACGSGNSTMGPFYCPVDRKIYIDLGFYDELAKTFNAPGELAQAYVIAHEVGHHVQKLLGTSDVVAAKRGQRDYNEFSVRLELQADFYAGVWAHHSHDELALNDQDIEDAMRAANAIGDDAIQKKTQGKVVPHSFTHGTSEQRMRWFMKGLRSGKMEEGDTFTLSYSEL